MDDNYGIITEDFDAGMTDENREEKTLKKFKLSIKNQMDDHYLICKLSVFIAIIIFAFCIKAAGGAKCESLIASYHHYNSDRTALSVIKNKAYTLADKNPVTRRLKSIYKDAKSIFDVDEKENTESGMGGEDIPVPDGVPAKTAPGGSTFATVRLTQKMENPLPDARLTSGFGYRTNPIDGTYGFHVGVDLAMPTGTPVSAAFGGIIETCATGETYGNYVIIRHGEKLSTLYAHLDSFLLKEGDRITQGASFATVGNTGRSTGPHLHFEVRVNGVKTDPLLYLDKISYRQDTHV